MLISMSAIRSLLIRRSSGTLTLWVVASALAAWALPPVPRSVSGLSFWISMICEPIADSHLGSGFSLVDAAAFSFSNFVTRSLT